MPGIALFLRHSAIGVRAVELCCFYLEAEEFSINPDNGLTISPPRC